MTQPQNLFAEFLRGSMQSFAGRLACLNVRKHYGGTDATTISSMPIQYREMCALLGQLYALRNTQVDTLYKLGNITLEEAERLILRALHAVLLHEQGYYRHDLAKVNQEMATASTSSMTYEALKSQKHQLDKLEQTLSQFTQYFVGAPERKHLTAQDVLTFDLNYDEVHEREVSELNTLRQRAASAHLQLATAEGIHKNFLANLAKLLGCRENEEIIHSTVKSLKNRVVCKTCRNEREIKTHDPRVTLPCPTCTGSTHVHDTGHGVLYGGGPSDQTELRKTLSLGESPAATELQGLTTTREINTTLFPQFDGSSQPAEVETSHTYDATGKLVGISVTTLNPSPLQNATETPPMEKAWASSSYFTADMLAAARQTGPALAFNNTTPTAFLMGETFRLKYEAAYRQLKEHPYDPKRPNVDLLFPHPTGFAREILSRLQEGPMIFRISADPATSMDECFKAHYDRLITMLPCRQ